MVGEIPTGHGRQAHGHGPVRPVRDELSRNPAGVLMTGFVVGESLA
jgi:hypothetical protein